MKWYALISIFLIISSAPAVAQGGAVRGRVSDDAGVVLPGIPVIVAPQRDTARFQVSLTDSTGRYDFPDLAPGAYSLTVSCLGYDTRRENVYVFPESEIVLDLSLKTSALSLEGAVVEEKFMPIQVIGDTLRYSPGAFMDGGEETLGDLLDKLPGISVDKTGRVQAQGEQVRTILLNGNNLFKDNVQIATNNLSADLADKVEVINNYSDFDILNGFQTHEAKAINIKVKDTFIGRLSGHLNLAGGVADKFETNNNLLLLREKTMWSLSATANNTGVPLLSLADYFSMKGGISSVISSMNDNLEVDDNLLDFLTTDSNIYRNENGLAALNFYSQPSAKLKLEGSCWANLNRTFSQVQEEYAFLDNRAGYVKDVRDTNRISSFYGMLDVLFSPSQNANLHYRGDVFYNDKLHGTGVVQSGHAYAPVWKKKGLTANQSLTYIRKIRDDILSVNVSQQYSSSPTSLRMVADTVHFPFMPHFPDGALDLRQENPETRHQLGAEASYLLTLAPKYYLRTSMKVDFQKSRAGIQLLEEGERALHDQWVDRDYRQQQLTLRLHKNKGVFQFQFGGALRFLQLSMDNTDKRLSASAVRFDPHVGITIDAVSFGKLTLSYTGTCTPYSLDDYLTGVRIGSYDKYYRADRDAVGFERRQRLQAIYVLVDQFRGTQVKASCFYSVSDNVVSYDYRTSGFVTEAIPRRGGHQETLFADLEYSRRFAFTPLGCESSVEYNQLNYQCLLQGIPVDCVSMSPSVQASVETYFKRGVNAKLSMGYHYSTFRSYVETSQWWIDPFLQLSWTNGRLRVASSLTYTYNVTDKVDQELFNVGARCSYTLKNQKFQFELEGNNLLHLHDNMWNEIVMNDNIRSFRSLYTVPGNLLLRIKYYL